MGLRVLRPLPSYHPESFYGGATITTRFDPSFREQQRRKKVIVVHTMLLHHAQELDDDLRARSDKDLALAGFFGVVDGVERIVEDGGLDHGSGLRFSTRWWEVRYLHVKRRRPMVSFRCW